MSSTAGFSRTTIDLLRHGEAEGANCFRGATDDPLTDEGWHQMLRQCEGGQWQAVVSSPLGRCASFASAWAEKHQLKVTLDPDWREIDFGEWEGLQAAQIDPEALRRFYADPNAFTPPKAESYASFATRIRRAWETLLTRHSGQKVLVVTHAGVIRGLFSNLLAIPVRQSFQIELPHACLTRFSCFEDAAGRYVQFNFHKPV